MRHPQIQLFSRMVSILYIRTKEVLVRDLFWKRLDLLRCFHKASTATFVPTNNVGTYSGILRYQQMTYTNFFWNNFDCPFY